MKKVIFLVTTIAILTTVSLVMAKDNPEGRPFQALWDAISYLQEQIDNIEPAPTVGIIGFTYKTDLPHTLTNLNTYTDVPERTLSYTKKEESSILKITYEDSFGVHFKGDNGKCGWRLLVDGNPIGGEKWFQPTSAWGIQGERQSTSLIWILSGVSRGNHSFTIQSKRAEADEFTLECENGWAREGYQDNFLLIEEIIQ
jgi:hypothetical protein